MLPEFPEINDAPEFSPPPDLVAGPPWLMYACIFVCILVAGLVYWHWKKRQATTEQPPPVPAAPSVMAIKLLEDLRSRQASIPPKELNQGVVEIIRTWLHRSFGILANYRTPEEILALRQKPNQPLPPPILTEFQDFLLQTNALGYSQSHGSQPLDEVIDQAIDMIQRTVKTRTNI